MMLRIFLLVLMVISCKAARTGEGKFITVAHDEPERFVNGENVLIKRVHEPQWNIFYRFNKSCPDSRKTEKNYRALRENLAKYIRVWLAPLREITKRPIVDKFVFYKSREDNKSLAENGQDIDYEITARFSCEIGLRSFASRRGRAIFITQIARNGVSEFPVNFPYSRMHLLHELGHAFDLADTYVGSDFNPPSTGGLNKTIGSQPNSVMSGEPCFNAEWEGICLDDVRAIQWLYQYHWQGLDPKECPPEFIYEEMTDPDFHGSGPRTVGGCVYRQPLLVEMRQRHLSSAKRLLLQDKNLKINDIDKNGYTALHYAADSNTYICWTCTINLMKAFLNYPGIDVNITDNYGNTPLHWAAWFGNPVMLWMLLYVEWGKTPAQREETKVNAQNKYGMTALHNASKLGRDKTVEYMLIHTDIKPNIKDIRFGNTPLHEAAKNGHTEIVKMLLAHKNINRNLRNHEDKTARQLAESNGHEETAKAFD